MKQTLTTLALLFALTTSAQNYATLQWRPDEDQEQFSFVVIHQDTGDTLYQWVNQYTETFYSEWFNFPDGVIRFEITDTGCNGFGCGGFISLVGVSGTYWHVVDDFGCGIVHQTWFGGGTPAPSCPTDFDADGYTDVDDLLFFISHYGLPCNP